MADKYYDDGGDNTTGTSWATAFTTIVGAVAAMAAGDRLFMGNDSIESLSAGATLTLPGTPTNPNILISVQKDTPVTTRLAGCSITIANTKSLIFRGSFYAYGLTINIGTNGDAYLYFVNASNTYEQSIDTFNFIYGTGANCIMGFGAQNRSSLKLINCTCKFGHTKQALGSISDDITIDGLIVNAAGSVVSKLITSNNQIGGKTVVQNCDLTACAQGLVLFPSTISYVGDMMIRNCKLPANWNGTLVTGGVITLQRYRASMYNCDSGDTNYRFVVQDYWGSNVQETTLVANSGASDGTNRISWKIVTTANAHKFNPFKTQEIRYWNDTQGTQRTITIEIIHNAAALLTNTDIWHEVDYSSSTGNPLYQKTISRANDCVISTPISHTASTKNWSDLVTTRANSTAYAVNALLKVATNPGRVFICTASTGNSAASEPAGYTTAVDGDSITDGNCTFVAMKRQIMSITTSVGMPANKGFIICTICLAKASTTVYVDPNMGVV